MTQLWEQFREQFPVTRHTVYLNHASISPLCKPAADAMRRAVDDVSDYGSLHYDQWLAAYDGVRKSGAKMLNASPAEIAIVKNTSEGIATVANGLDWQPGDRVVVFAEEFPANLLPWKRLESHGVSLECLSVSDSLERIDEACKGARLLALSFVQYLSGRRADLSAIGEICARREVLFFVDAIQGLGAFPIDVQACRIHALAADGHKWLLGPEGCGILYVRRDLQDEVRPIEFGWTNVAAYADYSSDDLSLRPNAARYECGTLNTVGCFGLRAAMDFLLDIGIEQIAAAVNSLTDRVQHGVKAKNFELLFERHSGSGAGIVAFRSHKVESRKIVRDLKEQGFLAAPRQGWVRVSPHFYISPAEIEAMLDALP